MDDECSSFIPLGSNRTFWKILISSYTSAKFQAPHTLVPTCELIAQFLQLWRLPVVLCSEGLFADLSSSRQARSEQKHQTTKPKLSEMLTNCQADSSRLRRQYCYVTCVVSYLDHHQVDRSKADDPTFFVRCLNVSSLGVRRCLASPLEGAEFTRGLSASPSLIQGCFYGWSEA